MDAMTLAASLPKRHVNTRNFLENGWMSLDIKPSGSLVINLSSERYQFPCRFHDIKLRTLRHGLYKISSLDLHQIVLKQACQ